MHNIPSNAAAPTVNVDLYGNCVEIFRLQEVEEANQNVKQMQHLTSLLPLASLPKDTSALLQYLANEPADSGLNVMFYCFDPLVDVDSA